MLVRPPRSFCARLAEISKPMQSLTKAPATCGFLARSTGMVSAELITGLVSAKRATIPMEASSRFSFLRLVEIMLLFMHGHDDTGVSFVQHCLLLSSELVSPAS